MLIKNVGTKPVYMRENGTICPFGFFSPFSGSFASKLDIFPFKTLCFGSVERAGNFGGRKGQRVNLGSQKTAQMPAKQRRDQQDHIGIITGFGLKLGQK